MKKFITALKIALALVIAGPVFHQAMSGEWDGPGQVGPKTGTWSNNAFCNTIGYVVVHLTRRWTCAPGIPLNVTWFGATGNGSTDDTAAIKATITAAASNPVFVPQGNYLVSCSGTCDIFASTTPLNVIGMGNGSGPGAASQSNVNVSQFLLNCSTCNAFKVTSIYPSIFRDIKINVNPGFRPHSGIGINLIGTGTTNVANYKISNVGFTNVGTDIRVLRPTWGEISGCYFDTWGNSAVYLETSSGIESSGGYVFNNFFFGLSTTTTPPIYSEVGYTILDSNEILGGNNGVQFTIKNFSAGFIKITNNTIENFSGFGVLVQSGDGSTSSMVMIQNNEFSDNSNMPTASIFVADNTTTPAWISDVLIQGNVSRNETASGGRHIWIGAGTNVIVSDNVIDELGANSPQGINVGGATTNAGLSSPILLSDNSFIGTFSKKYETAVAVAVIKDNIGMALSSLPSGGVANGSQIFFTDGNPGSSPCTGTSTGSMGFRQNGAWKCF